jgi:lipoprotein
LKEKRKKREVTMRRNIHYKPSKSASILSGVIACAMGVFGLFTIPSIGAMIGFKAIWCLMAFGMGIYNFLLAAGVVKYNGGYEITDESDESAKGGKSDAEARLEELQTLYDRRLITEEEYQQKRRDILDRL